ncbi:MAG: hypothetical protein KA004_02765 [Verrucomicrobiales bacterium]|nr:hypothetical protein [Verrucomicrobiales bacterium]
MKSILSTAFAGLFLFAASTQGQTPAKCDETLKKLEAEIAKEPSRILLAVEDAVTVAEHCACDIVKTAIATSKADPKLVGEIVSTAVTAAPAAASTIGECALAASPEAASEIKKAMQAALGQGDSGASDDQSSQGSGKEPIASGKEPVAGKEPITSGKQPVAGKEPVAPPAKTEDDFTGGALAPTGVYLMPPNNGAPGSEKEIIVKVIRTTEVRKKHKPRTGSTPCTKS